MKALLRNPRAPTVYEGRHGSMADSASYAACGHGRLPKDTAERGLTSRLWPPYFEDEEEEPQLEDKKRENDQSMSQARPDRDVLRDGTSRTGLGRRSVK